MPKYAFECPVCELRFERNLKVGNHPTHNCPSCKDPAPLVVSGFGFSFGEGGEAQSNSGVHGHDYPTADQAVGRSAKRRWEHLEARDKVKKEARRQGQTHALIRHTGEGYIDYEPMNDQGREARRKLVKEAEKASAKPER